MIYSRNNRKKANEVIVSLSGHPIYSNQDFILLFRQFTREKKIMVCDLDYFNESDLDVTNIKEFYDTLPPHLQMKFKASLHGIQIGEGNVLQGYRGPSEMCNEGSGDSKELKPSHGLQEIKFWWGARKDFNFIPIVGTIIYTGCRIGQSLSGNLDWSSLYFDSHTGECLSHDKHKAIKKLKSRRRKTKSKMQASVSNYDSDEDSEPAEDSDFQEDELFNQRNNIRAQKYVRNYQKAQVDNDAKERFYEGNRLCMLGRYEEAEAEYWSAYHMSDVDNERRIYKQCAERAHIEECAVRFNIDGNDSFHDGKFEDAICWHKRAIEISQVDERIEIYRTNIANAHNEIHALGLNSQGNALFNKGKYWEALSECRLASQKSQVGVQIQEYRSNVAKAQVDVDALELNSLGHNFLNQGRYDDAISMYLEARATSKVSAQRKQYEANADKAKAEADADIFNYQGNKLFKDGYYAAALSKYQDACKTSERAARLKIYRDNLAKVQVEIDALKLNSQGDSFFNAGRYNEATKIYLEAHAKSKVSAQSQKYKPNADRAKAEVDAANFNSQGDKFFNEGKFNKAVGMYQLACNKSQVGVQIQKYKVNIVKAQVEIVALKLNAQGDSFFNAGRYNEAVKIYLEAKNKSQTTKQKDMYLLDKNKAQDIINKLNTLDTLWKQAWDVENDKKTDRSTEAKDLFQNILSESEENLKAFAGNSKFEQFKALAALKIEGNELFNEGVNSQKNGVALFKEAQILNQQQKYQLANQKFKEANKYFQEALEKFEKGSKSDHGFTPCVEFVQEKVNVVIESIKVCEQRMLSAGLQKLDIHFDSDTQRSDTEICKLGEDGNHKQYSQHV